MIDSDRLPDARGLETTWSLLETATRRLLLVDFDGTLAPFEVDRMSARAVPGALEALATIRAREVATVAVVSGRPLAELEALTHPLDAILVGEHGWEMRTPRGGRRAYATSASARALLEDAAARASPVVEPPRLERKRTGIVVHTRGMSRPAAECMLAEVAERWRDFGRRSEVRLHRIDGGAELRASGNDKGTALEAIRTELGGDPLTVCIGDDETDEDAFRRVAAAGLGVVVGTTGRPTAARARLPNVYAVVKYLELWLKRLPAPRTLEAS